MLGQSWQNGQLLNKWSKGCFVCEKYRGMVEMLSRADPCSSGRMITGRYNVGYMWELSVGTEQILFILQLPRLCEPITEAQCF